MRAYTDSDTADPDLASGVPDVSDCTEPMQPTWAPWPGGQPETLTLTYATLLAASRVDVFHLGNPAGILQVEAQNSLTGQAQTIYNGGQAPVRPETQCPAQFTLPVALGFEIDTLVITIAADEKPVQIDAVSLTAVCRALPTFRSFGAYPLA